MKILRAAPLTATAFAPFGDLVAATPDQSQRLINEGHTTRFHDLANIQAAQDGGRLTVNIFRTTARDMPLTLHQMERHPKSSQLFMPLGPAAYLVVVAPAGDFDGAGMRAFIAAAGQGVNYHAGVWHHYSLALPGLKSQQSDFLVVDYAGLGDNCDIMELPEPVRVTV
ncbi:Ureidoglycolate lyase [hydrothermal vent metagenome]|uniref:Ureidoglycolate lyase n=1 Tax=hydrothermal vent metagenome TaxID=652676 RepID=A0A3B0RV64_9ZZZZ